MSDNNIEYCTCLKSYKTYFLDEPDNNIEICSNCHLIRIYLFGGMIFQGSGYIPYGSGRNL